MKRICFALAVMGLSTAVYAALPAAPEPSLVNIPLIPGGFVLGFSAYNLQPSASGNDLVYAAINTGVSSPFASSLKEVEPSYSWGWDANLGYVFPNTGNDINLNYFQLNTGDSSSVSIALDAPAISIPNIGNQTILAPHSNISVAQANAEYTINQADLTAGQFINVGRHLILHSNLGLRWAHLERELDSTYSAFYINTKDAGTVLPRSTLQNNENSNFNGIGPLLGFDGSYALGGGFGIASHISSALLIGDISSQANLTATIWSRAEQSQTLIKNTVKTDNTSNNTHRVIPALNAKLGLDYTYILNASISTLTIEAGWQVSHYFNAIDRLQLNATNGSVAPNNIVSRNTSDLGLNGFYASLTFHA